MKLFGSFANTLTKPPDNFEQILWKFFNQRWKISGIFLKNFRVFLKIIPDLKKQKKKKKKKLQ